MLITQPHVRRGRALWMLCLVIAVAALTSVPAQASVLTVVDERWDGVGGVDGLDGARSVVVSPDGGHVYVGGFDDDAVAVFARNPLTGVLTFVEMQLDNLSLVDGLDGAFALAMTDDGTHLYVAGNADDKLAAFARNPATGALTIVDIHRDDIAGVNGLNGATGVALSPDGAHVYVTANVDDAVAVFSRNASTGVLTFVEMQQDGLGGVDGLDGASGARVSPDGAHVYVSGELDDAIAVFSRNPTTGALTFVEMQQDGIGGVDGLDAAMDVVLSPDGLHVYTAAATDDAVAVFGRNPTTGALTFVEMQRDGISGVDGLNGATAVTLSPTGSRLYAAGVDDDAIAVFTRNPTTGALTFTEIQRDGVASANALNGIRSLAIAPTGSHLYTGAQIDDAVSTFQVTLCGDSLIDPGEECDDGNTSDGDCCSSLCQFESTGSACVDDGNACTDDKCNGTGTCLHPNNTLACDDASACTSSDTCSGGSCAGTPVNCDDSNLCTDDSCDPGSGCLNVNNTIPCSDGNACTVGDACSGGTCASGAPANCEDDNVCTTDSCDGGSGCVHVANALPCNDMLFCTVAETCSAGLCTGLARDCSSANDQCNVGTCDEAAGACEPAPSPEGSVCDDGNACTLDDACTAGICTGASSSCGDGIIDPDCAEGCDDGNTTDGDGCSATCTLETCGATPESGCLDIMTSHNAPLTLKDSRRNTKDQLTWKWTEKMSLPTGILGSPQASTSYELCLYDATAGLIASAVAPGGAACDGQTPCWRTARGGFKYVDTRGAFDGLRLITLSAKGGKVKVVVKGKGPALDLPPLPIASQPITLMLKNAEGACWGATYSSSAKNTATQFKARAD
jgi:cysteine-rich repeat protein